MKADELEKKKQSQSAQEDIPLGERAKREALAWFWIILAFLLINGVVGQARVIPSASMENTLLIGDHLIMSRLGYDAGIPFTPIHWPLWRKLNRQQIVIFRAPVDGSPDWVKRVIGLSGDTLEVHDGAVWINGQKLTEPYIKEPMDPFERFGPVQVPPDHYFVMGDNRGNSYDSRFVGPIARDSVIGVPVMIYLSVDATASMPEAWEPGHLLERFEAYGNGIIHPSRIRWNRFFKTF
ncbi:MAG TPA: signal peptidase I [Candidatus Acidoferrales bacterium]|nr:signal peptidase I [Candidatus Acidoferrales bacterium]